METLETRFRSTADRALRDRLQIILLAHKGRPHHDIATDLSIHRKTVTRWLNTYCDGRLDTLQPKAKGQELGIPAAFADEIKGWVIGGPANQALDRANWTHEELADHLKRTKRSVPPGRPCSGSSSACAMLRSMRSIVAPLPIQMRFQLGFLAKYACSSTAMFGRSGCTFASWDSRFAHRNVWVLTTSEF